MKISDETKNIISGIVKKILILLVLAFLALILFAPTDNGKDIRNVPLLIISVSSIILYFFIRCLLTYIFALRVGIVLKNKKGLMIKSALVLFKTGYICAEDRNNVYRIRLYHGIKQKYRYHLETPHLLEIYKTTRAGYSASRFKGMHHGATKTTLVSCKKFLNFKNKSRKPLCDIVVFNVFPEMLTDSANDLRRDPICEGDDICNSETVVYSLEGLKRHFEN